MVNQPPCRNFAIDAMKNMELDGQEHHGEHDRADPLAVVPYVDGQQHGGGDHRDGQRQAVCGGNMLRIRKMREYGSVETHSTPLTTGMYSWPRVRAGYRTCR